METCYFNSTSQHLFSNAQTNMAKVHSLHRARTQTARGCDVSIDQLDGTARYGRQAPFLRFLLPATCRLRRLRSIPSLWQHASLIGRNHASRAGVAPVKFPSPM